MDYINSKTREVLRKRDLAKLLNASLPTDLEQIGDWYQVHYGTMPEEELGYSIERGDIEEVDGVWQYVYHKVEKPLDMVKDELKRRVTDERWRVEQGGVNVEGIGVIATDADDQSRLTATVMLIQTAERLGTPINELDFKGTAGWIKLPAAQVVQIGVLMGQFVETCFTAERKLHEDVDKCKSLAELKAVDLSKYWDPRAVYKVRV